MILTYSKNIFKICDVREIDTLPPPLPLYGYVSACTGGGWLRIAI